MNQDEEQRSISPNFFSKGRSKTVEKKGRVSSASWPGKKEKAK
jgi:hypothetical protein